MLNFKSRYRNIGFVLIFFVGILFVIFFLEKYISSPHVEVPPPILATNLPSVEHDMPTIDRSNVPPLLKNVSLQEKLVLLSKGDGQDLLDFVRNAKNSAKPQEVFLGMKVIEACEGYLPPYSATLNTTPLQLMKKNGDVIRAAEEAIRRMKQRCAIFLNLPRSEFDDIKVDIKKKAGAKDFPFAGISAIKDVGQRDINMALAREQIKAQLNQYGAWSLLWISADFAEFASKKQKTAQFDPNLIQYQSLYLALCVAGYPCEEPTNESDNMCMNLGLCGAGLRESVLAMVVESERGAMNARAHVIFHAIRNKNWMILGLME